MAKSNVLTDYLEAIASVKARLNASDPAYTIKIEQHLLNVRQAPDQDKGVETLKEETQKALALIDQADELLKNHQFNYWLTFVLAASIMLQ